MFELRIVVFRSAKSRNFAKQNLVRIRDFAERKTTIYQNEDLSTY